MDRHIQRAVSEIRSAVEDRVKAVEDTCKDLIQAIEFREKEQREEIESLRLKVLELEHAAYQQKHEANVVFSGLPESSHAGEENCKSVIHDFCKETLGLELKEEEIVHAVRLGNTKKRRENDRVCRPILVQTNCKATKSRITACRGPHLRRTGVYLNEDLSRQEQISRRALVPVYKKLRERNIKCHMDRACLTVGDKRAFNQQQAEELLHTCVSPEKQQNPTASQSRLQ